MGAHNNHQRFHRRVAALKQRRLPPDEEAAKLKELIARFSPTFVWTATLTDSIPLPTLPAAIATTTSASDDGGDGKGNALVTTSSSPTPTPVTTPTVPTTTSTTPVVNTNTAVTPTPAAQTTNAAPTTSTTTVVVPPPVTTSTPPVVVTKPSITPQSLATTPGSVTSLTTTSPTVSVAAASATETGSSESGTNVGGIAYGPVQMMPPNSAAAMVNNSPYPNTVYPNPAYVQSPFSPIAAPVSANINEENHNAAVLTRQSSNNSRASSAHGPAGYPSEDPNNGGSTSPKQGEYVDLNRSSVTPFQAAQYTEISQKLGTETPSGFTNPSGNAIIQHTNEVPPSLPAKDNETSSSPFSDPIIGQLPYPSEVSPRPSTDSVSRQIDDFPVPPSPVHSNLSRVDSVPPMLPEIPMGSRPSSYNFPASDRGSYIPNNTTKEYSKSPLGNQSPANPSPLASGASVSPPLHAATSLPDAAPLTPRQNKFEAPAKRPDTVYDDQDAYGGI
ncbi:hypothetical protein C0993_007916 [Termitomyces sp. T159_Od127]|nr:hypothetical protein C0993_007916 [Termitomyces sp. T159_Od127]